MENIVPLSKYSGVEDTDVMFVYSDPSGNFLVTMSSSSAKALNLNSGVSTEISMDGYEGQFCYHSAAPHLSSNENQFFTLVGRDDPIRQPGEIIRFNFSHVLSDTSSNFCYERDIGSGDHFMCVTDNNQITMLNETCKGPPPPLVVSGIVDRSTVYLFTKSNDIYYFSKKAFDGKTVPLAKVSRKIVWKDSVQTTTPSSSASEYIFLFDYPTVS